MEWEYCGSFETDRCWLFCRDPKGRKVGIFALGFTLINSLLWVLHLLGFYENGVYRCSSEMEAVHGEGEEWRYLQCSVTSCMIG